MKLHHIGFVVADIDAAAAGYPGAIETARVFDPLQCADLALFSCGGTSLEFIRPNGPDAFTWRFLEAGGGFHHLCFVVPDMAAVETILRRDRLMKVRGPIPAVLFDGCPVVFAINRNRQVIEFVVPT